MAIHRLNDQQIQDWTREQKDRWWRDHVFRGDMPQLTLRSAITGFVLGGLLSATNLYIGAKTGWTLGVGLTSVILAFALFKALSGMGMRDMTILENNAMQSIATSAGYMTGPLISGIAAYMMVTNALMPWHQMLLFNVVLSILGVLVAFPMKRRFINDEQAPFPEGAACGVVLDTLYTSDASVGLFKARVLVVAGLFAGFLKFITGEGYQLLLQSLLLGRKAFYHMSEHLDAWYYHLADAGRAPIPRIAGIDVRKLGLSPTLDLAMFGAGGLLNIRYACNMVVGMVLAWAVAAPTAVSSGWARIPKTGATILVDDKFAYRDVLTSWVLWPGVAMLVCASLTTLFAKPKMIIDAFRGLAGRKVEGADVLKDVEVPLWISWVGIPIVGAVGVWMAHDWFGVKWQWGALAIPLTILLTLIAANSTAMTSITPTGSLSKITQFTFGALEPKTPSVNLMTATITTEVASNASNLLMDIKPGYMLGGKPRHQAVGHCIGIVAGALASTPLFFMLFLPGMPGNAFSKADPAKAGVRVEEALVSEKFSFVGAVQWKGVSDFVKGLTGDVQLTSIIHGSALWAMGIAAVLGIAFELARVFTKNKSPISPVALALGMVLPPDSTFWMFLGSAFFWMMGRLYRNRKESMGHRLWIQTHEPICAGLIAGAALTGIGDILINNFVA